MCLVICAFVNFGNFWILLVWFGWCGCGWCFGWTSCLLGCGFCAWLVCSLVLWWCLRVWVWVGCGVVDLVDCYCCCFCSIWVARFWFAYLVWLSGYLRWSWLDARSMLGVLLFGDLLVCDSGLGFGG